MADPETIDSGTGVTTELALSDVHGVPLARQEELRDQLPGLEAERHVTDWGRSERVEALFDRTLYEFFYHYWFRVEVEGIEHVPSGGGALLVANHGGALPADAAMIAKAVREEHPARRALHVCTEQPLAGVPGLGMLVTKLGVVSAHPANLHRLLFDEGELALVFPEGRPAARKSLKERYRLRPFEPARFVPGAMRAGVPIVPLAVVGAEEAAPVLARLNPLRRLRRLPQLPLVPLLPLPAKFKLRFLEPVELDGLGDRPWSDQSLVRRVSEEIRALIQENVLEMIGARRSVWLG